MKNKVNNKSYLEEKKTEKLNYNGYCVHLN